MLSVPSVEDEEEEDDEDEKKKSKDKESKVRIIPRKTKMTPMTVGIVKNFQLMENPRFINTSTIYLIPIGSMGLI